MPLSSKASLAQLQTESVAFVRTRFPAWATGLFNFLGKFSSAWAMGMFGLQRTAEAIDRDSPPQTKSSRAGLTAWADTGGVPSNAGGYGPNLASPASGGLGPVTGAGGTAVGAGQQLAAPDGVTIVELVGAIVIPASGSFAAVTPGTVGNLQAGTVLTWLTPPAGCDPTMTLSAALSGGLDLETTESLFSRVQTRFQIPPKGGADVDYKAWAESIKGVYRAFVYPRRAGTGTVDVVITTAGSGQARIPGLTLTDAVKAYIDSIRPTDNETFNALGPAMPAGKRLTIRVRGVPAPGYGWDWIDTAASWTVAAYNAGAPSITLSAAAPQSLVDAVNGVAKPRIQVLVTTAGFPIIPEQVRVVAIDVTHTILTLEHAFALAPTNGDTVKAGSYLAPVVAKAVLDYVDSVGPSRVSGFGSDALSWDDVVAIFRIGNAALDAKDTDGVTRLLKNIVHDGATIAIGSGFPLTSDYQPDDTDLLESPELAEAVRVYCTQ